jgi:hypothetical protein
MALAAAVAARWPLTSAAQIFGLRAARETQHYSRSGTGTLKPLRVVETRLYSPTR